MVMPGEARGEDIGMKTRRPPTRIATLMRYLFTDHVICTSRSHFSFASATETLLNKLRRRRYR